MKYLFTGFIGCLWCFGLHWKPLSNLTMLKVCLIHDIYAFSGWRRKNLFLMKQNIYFNKERRLQAENFCIFQREEKLDFFFRPFTNKIVCNFIIFPNSQQVSKATLWENFHVFHFTSFNCRYGNEFSVSNIMKKILQNEKYVTKQPSKQFYCFAA